MAEHTYDVAIVGAGVAGAILARRLATAGADVVILEAGEATGLTWERYQANIRQFLMAGAKVPNSAWANSPAAPSPNVLDIVPLQAGGAIVAALGRPIRTPHARGNPEPVIEPLDVR